MNAGGPAHDLQGDRRVEHDRVDQARRPPARQDRLDRGEIGRDVAALELGEPGGGNAARLLKI